MPKTSPYRLLALDLDGTLIRHDLVIAPPIKAALAAVRQQGIQVVVASGRMHRSAAMLARELGLNGPLISYQGAMTRDIDTDETYYHNPIPRDLANQVVAEAVRRNYHIHIYANDEIYTAVMDAESLDYGRLNRHDPLAVGDLIEFMVRENINPTKALIVTDPDSTTRLLGELQAEFGDRLYITRSYPTFTDAVNISSSKGAALSALASRLNIPREQVMAIGDNLNDVPMLEWAGFGAAVANASESAKAAADYVASGEVWEGVVEVLEKFVLI